MDGAPIMSCRSNDLQTSTILGHPCPAKTGIAPRTSCDADDLSAECSAQRHLDDESRLSGAGLQASASLFDESTTRVRDTEMVIATAAHNDQRSDASSTPVADSPQSSSTVCAQTHDISEIHHSDGSEPLSTALQVECDPVPPSHNEKLPPDIAGIRWTDLSQQSDESQFAMQELDTIREEFKRCWILNMSINFRDHSSREKFFITYAVDATTWHRLTISVQYLDAPAESLEAELRDTRYQRDKSFCIFDALRDSLPTIHFFDTITNLKLVTDPEDDQLHVHVREDTNEIIDFPAIGMFDHIRCPRYPEDILTLDSHISGFVYKVKRHDQVLIRKDIPGRDSVDEFMYELNALNRLKSSPNIIRLRGLVTNSSGTIVKGLLLHYATKGSLADMLYDVGKSALEESRREKWARQITKGLADIHETGFVQGDFTLSNIVIDEEDTARIIDINRRGCPLGWEPPELLPLIQAGHRISMYISAKTDLYQLGMVLWALAKHDDDPDQHTFGPVQELEVSNEYQAVVSICLSRNPKHRLSAIQLVSIFRSCAEVQPYDTPFMHSFASDIGERYGIDPVLAVTLDEISHHRQQAAWSTGIPEDGHTHELQGSFQSRGSSVRRYADSSACSAPRSRGRSLQRREYVAETRDHTAASGTSLSSLSTNEAKLAISPANVLAATSEASMANQPAVPKPCNLCFRDSGFEDLFDLATEKSPPAKTNQEDQALLSSDVSEPAKRIVERVTQ